MQGDYSDDGTQAFRINYDATLNAYTINPYCKLSRYIGYDDDDFYETEMNTYSVKFNGGGGNTEAEQFKSAKNLIQTYVLPVTEYYANFFNFELVNYFYPAGESSIYDHHNYNGIALHTNEEVMEHFTEYFEESIENNTSTTMVLWSQHLGSNDDGNRSAFQPTTNAIVMLETSAPNKKAVFLHEMAHQFGAIDHYHNLPEDIEGDDLCSNRPYCSTCGTDEDKYTLNPYDPSTDADNETCVMETNNHSNFIETCNSVFCTHCIDDIRDHIPTMPW